MRPLRRRGCRRVRGRGRGVAGVRCMARLRVSARGSAARGVRRTRCRGRSPVRTTRPPMRLIWNLIFSRACSGVPSYTHGSRNAFDHCAFGPWSSCRRPAPLSNWEKRAARRICRARNRADECRWGSCLRGRACRRVWAVCKCPTGHADAICRASAVEQVSRAAPLRAAQCPWPRQNAAEVFLLALPAQSPSCGAGAITGICAACAGRPTASCAAAPAPSTAALPSNTRLVVHGVEGCDSIEIFSLVATRGGAKASAPAQHNAPSAARSHIAAGSSSCVKHLAAKYM